MIKYGYFRHRFDAHQNAKLNAFIDDVGVIGYAYYYTLLELYGSKINSQEDQESAEIHLRIIANVWRKRVDSVRLVLTKLRLSGLLVVAFNGSTCTIAIPNYMKYYGSYKKTERYETAKEKKRKEKKEKNPQKKEKAEIESAKIYKFDFEKLWNIYPRKRGKEKGFELLEKTIKSDESFALILESVENFALEMDISQRQETRIPYFNTFLGSWHEYLSENGWKRPEGQNNASEKSAKVIQIIHDLGFDSRKIKEKLGAEIFEAIGGGNFILQYSRSNQQTNSNLISELKTKLKPLEVNL